MTVNFRYVCQQCREPFNAEQMMPLDEAMCADCKSKQHPPQGGSVMLPPPPPEKTYQMQCKCGMLYTASLRSHQCPRCGDTALTASFFKEAVNHPAHYGGADNPYEAIKVIEAWKLGFNLGNTVKYISRHADKESALTDLKKAAWYLNREISNMEKQACAKPSSTTGTSN